MAETKKLSVARMWEGRTPAAGADAYTRYLLENGIEKITKTPGNLGVHVLRRVEGDVAYFTTISYWASRAQIVAFAGADIEKPHHLPKDPEYLLELPQRVKHFDVLLDTSSECGTESSG